MRGQAAVEYFVVVGLVVMFMIPLWAYMVATQDDIGQEISLSYAKTAATQIADAASLVHSQGYPAKISIRVYIPDGVINVSLAQKTVSFNITYRSLVTDVWAESNAEMNGTIPVNEGYYNFDIHSMNTYVQINQV